MFKPSLRFLVLFATVLAAGRLPADDCLPRVNEECRKVLPSVIQWRRDIHANPELSNREERTGRVVAERLRAIGVDEIKTGVARNGIVALVRGRKPGKTVALRADMDALPVQEKTGLPFASQRPGVMHACGHDAHTAMLLGTAKVLCSMRESIPGTVKLIFQPSEEGAPAGEEAGAALMIKEGVLTSPDVSAVFGLHVASDLVTGQVGYRPGAIMAGVDRFRVTVTGKQSHAAYPWKGEDPIVAAAYLVSALQTIVSRNVDAREAAVVSIGIIRGGQAWNIIPGEVTLEGTIRTLSPEVRRLVNQRFRQIVEHTAKAHGVKATITAMEDYAPPVWNDPELTKRMKPALERAAGPSNAVEARPVLGGEDFALYAQKVPAMYVFLGVRNESIGAVHAPHTPEFMLDEAALGLGVRTMSLLALDYLTR